MKYFFRIATIVSTALSVFLVYTPLVKGNPRAPDQSIEHNSDRVVIKADPESFLTTPGKPRKIKITGGLPPYRWYTISGDIQKITQNSFLYTAPQRYGHDTITFEDRAGQKEVVKVKSLRPVTISPQNPSLRIKEKAVFAISGGSGEWEVTQHKGFKIIEKNETTLILEALENTGEKTIVIQDKKTGEIKKNHIKVYDTLKIDINSS